MIIISNRLTIALSPRAAGICVYVYICCVKRQNKRGTKAMYVCINRHYHIDRRDPVILFQARQKAPFSGKRDFYTTRENMYKEMRPCGYSTNVRDNGIHSSLSAAYVKCGVI